MTGCYFQTFVCVTEEDCEHEPTLKPIVRILTRPNFDGKANRNKIPAFDSALCKWKWSWKAKCRQYQGEKFVIIFRYKRCVCCIHVQQIGHQPGIAVLVSWTGIMEFPLSPFLSKKMVSRVRSGRPVARQSAHSIHLGWIWCLLRDTTLPPCFPLWRLLVETSCTIGSTPTLPGYINNCVPMVFITENRISSPRGRSHLAIIYGKSKLKSKSADRFSHTSANSCIYGHFESGGVGGWNRIKHTHTPSLPPTSLSWIHGLLRLALSSIIFHLKLICKSIILILILI